MFLQYTTQRKTYLSTWSWFITSLKPLFDYGCILSPPASIEVCTPSGVERPCPLRWLLKYTWIKGLAIRWWDGGGGMLTFLWTCTLGQAISIGRDLKRSDVLWKSTKISKPKPVSCQQMLVGSCRSIWLWSCPGTVVFFLEPQHETQMSTCPIFSSFCID